MSEIENVEVDDDEEEQLGDGETNDNQLALSILRQRQEAEARAKEAEAEEDDDEDDEEGVELEDDDEDDGDEEGDGEEAAEEETKPEGEKEKESTKEKPEEKTEKAALDDESVHTVKIDDKEEQVTLKELKAAYQKKESSDRRFIEAANQKKAAAKLADDVKQNPLSVAYHLLAPEIGDEQAYQHVLAAATQLVGSELEFKQLPPEEQKLRQQETALQRKEREIERLRQQQEQQSAATRSQALGTEIMTKASAAGIKEILHLRMIAQIFDTAEAAGSPITVDQAIDEFLSVDRTTFSSRLSTLSEDELKKHGLRKADDPESGTTKPKGKIPKAKTRKGTSTAKAKKRKRTQRPTRKSPYFSNWEEAARAADPSLNR